MQKSTRAEPTKYSNSSAIDNDIKSILARPYKLATGVLVNNHSTLYTVDVNRDLFVSQAASRLSGVYGIRAKVVFKVQVVATPFDQGRLKLVFQPLTFIGDITTYSAIRPDTAHQLPGVELDLNTQTEAVLSVPWIYPKDYMILQTYPPGGARDYIPLGRFGLTSILPWSSGSGAAPRFTIWYWLEDVEFYGTTGAPAIVADPVSGLAAVASGVAAYREACKESPELRISTISSRIRGWTSMLGARFPKLQYAFQPAEWLLEQVGKTAAAWGFSRPLVTMQGKRVYATNQTAFSHMDSPDYSWPLTASVKNETPGVTFGCDMDEMAVQYLGASFGLVGSFTVSTTNPLSTLLYHTINSPASFFFNPGQPNKKKSNRSLQAQPAGTNILFSLPVPATFVANCFQFWRGKVQYRLQFGKTAFHAGRIRITVVPNEVIAGNTGAPNTCLTATTLNGTNYSAVSYVVDLKGLNDFDIEVPWDYQAQWKDPWETGHSVMYIQVEDPLIAPATCAQTIHVNVLARVLDMEVAQPIAPRFLPYPPALVAADVSGDATDLLTPPEAPPPAYVVSDNYVRRSPIFMEYVSGEASSVMGEVVNSIKQVVQIQTCVLATKHTTHTNAGLVFAPEDWRPIGTATSVISPSYNRYLDYFASAYRAYTGGQSFTILTRPACQVVVTRGNTNRPENWATLTSASTSMATAATGTDQVRFKLPYQEVTPVVPLSAGVFNNDITYTNHPRSLRSSFTYNVDPTTVVGGVTKHGIFSGASDDFRFYYFAVTPFLAMSRNTGDPRPSDAYTTFTTQ